MNNTAAKNNLAEILRQAMGPGFAFNSGGALERLTARTSDQARRH